MTRHKRLTATALMAAGLLAYMALQSGSPQSPNPEVARADDPESAYYGYYDQTEKTFLAIQVGSGNAREGEWALAVPGVGLYWPSFAATMTPENDDSITVSFSGSATLDTAASLDPVFGATYIGSGGGNSVTVTLNGTISDDRGTASFSLVHGLSEYTVESEAVASSAAAAVTDTIDALELEDFAALRLLHISDLATAINEQDFVASMVAGFGPFGTIIDATQSGSTVYSLNPGTGPQYASVTLEVTFQDGLLTPTYSAPVTYLFYENSWRIIKFGRFAEERDLTFLNQPGRAILSEPAPVPIILALTSPDGEIDAADDSTEVTLGIATGPVGAALTCDGGLTAMATDGVVEFTGCEFDKSGTVVLTATAPNKTPVLSEEIQVVRQSGTLLLDEPPLSLTNLFPGRPVTFSFEAGASEFPMLLISSPTVGFGVAHIVSPSGEITECEIINGECFMDFETEAGEYTVMVRGRGEHGDFIGSLLSPPIDLKKWTKLRSMPSPTTSLPALPKTPSSSSQCRAAKTASSRASLSTPRAAPGTCIYSTTSTTTSAGPRLSTRKQSYIPRRWGLGTTVYTWIPGVVSQAR